MSLQVELVLEVGVFADGALDSVGVEEGSEVLDVLVLLLDVKGFVQGRVVLLETRFLEEFLGLLLQDYSALLECVLVGAEDQTLADVVLDPLETQKLRDC